MPTSFEDVYDEHIWRVYGFFAYRLGSRDDAEDLTQLTFERALKAWVRYDPERASLETWLMTIARNLLIDHYRANELRRLETLDLGNPRHEPSVDISEQGLGISYELSSALGKLPQRDREIIALRFGGELSGPEIAEMTGLTLANVQQILSRSLRKLRTLLDLVDVP